MRFGAAHALYVTPVQLGNVLPLKPFYAFLSSMRKREYRSRH